MTVFSPAGEAQFELLCGLSRELEAAWRSAFADESTRLAEISRLSRELEAASEFPVEALAPGLHDCLALEGALPPFRVSQVDETDGEGRTLRLRAEPGLDLRVTECDGRVTLQGRGRPEFHLYEYLSSALGPQLEEDSRLESMERVVLRRRAADGSLLAQTAQGTGRAASMRDW